MPDGAALIKKGRRSYRLSVGHRGVVARQVIKIEGVNSRIVWFEMFAIADKKISAI